jgi:hypothetical protein
MEWNSPSISSNIWVELHKTKKKFIRDHKMERIVRAMKISEDNETCILASRWRSTCLTPVSKVTNKRNRQKRRSGSQAMSRMDWSKEGEEEEAAEEDELD